MPLEFRGSGASDYFGFFEFSEGREFLRSVLPIFQEETGCGDKKLGSILVAASQENFLKEKDKEAEDAAVTQALKRWQKGQADLWATKPEKSRKYLMLLEQQMMVANTSRAILKGKADALLTNQAQAGAAAFFYGADSARYSLDDIYEKQLDVAGLYQCLIKVTGVKSDDPVGMEIEEEWLLRPVFHMLVAKEGVAHMEVHEFTLVQGRSSRVRHQRFGYAFPLSRRRVHRLMVGVDDRDVRSHDVLDVSARGDIPDGISDESFSIIKHYVQTLPAASYVPPETGLSYYDIKVDEFMVSVDDEMKAIVERACSDLASEIIF
jgi:hypothetical protein